MLSNKEIICPDNLLNIAHKKKGVKAGIVNAGKPLPMQSVQDAVKENLIEPIFIGDEKEIMYPGQNKDKRFRMNVKKEIKLSKIIKKDLVDLKK